jgi:hypothetical protein
MKTLILIFFALAHQTYGQSEPLQPKTMTPDAFRNQAAAANTVKQRVELAEAAFSSQQIELVKSCFNAPGMLGDFIGEFEKLPASDFKSQVVLNILKEKWPYDKMANGMRPPLTPPPLRLEEICLSVLTGVFPGAGLAVNDQDTMDKLRDARSRTELARMLEGKINPSEHQKTSKEDSNLVPKVAIESSLSGTTAENSSQHQLLPNTMPPPATKRAPEVILKTEPSELPVSLTPWSTIIVVSVVAALGLLWLLLKRRS